MKKRCEDCKHFVLNPDFNKTDYQKIYAICGRTSMVTTLAGQECRYERSSPFVFFWDCGRGARFFEKKEDV